MKKIPEELKKQGVRWILDINEEPRLLAVESVHVSVVVLKGREDDFLNGKKVYFESMRLFKEIPKSKKIPYTVETFPESAIWIRIKDKDCKFAINIIKGEIFFMNYSGNVIDVNFDQIDDYEIGFLTKHYKIEWRHFYQIKE